MGGARHRVRQDLPPGHGRQLPARRSRAAWRGQRCPGTLAALLMLYFISAVYIAALYIRPAEVVPSLQDLPVMDVLTALAASVALASFVSRPRRMVWVRSDGYI